LKQDKQSAVLYYFCGQQSSIVAKPAHVVCTLIAQLVRQNPDMAAYIYEEHIVSGHATSLVRAKQLLRTLIGTLTFIRVIIDGVDELDPCIHGLVIQDILSLSNTIDPATTCKVVVSGRNIPSISDKMNKYPALDLDKQRKCVDASIASYIKNELGALCVNLRQLHPNPGSIITEIEEELIEKAEGMHHCSVTLGDTHALLRDVSLGPLSATLFEGCLQSRRSS